VLTDCKNGSDKPDDKTLRLTLLRTPGTRGGYADQGTQDWGRHEIVFGLAGHAGDWRDGRTDWHAYRLNQPLMAFVSPRHAGFLGKTFSLLKVNNDRVRVLALKKAEAGDEVIVRLVEVEGKTVENVRVAMVGPIVSAREVNGQEQPVGPAKTAGGELVTSFGPYQPRTFALKLTAAPQRVSPPKSTPVPLVFDLSVAARAGRPADGSFDANTNNQNASQGKAFPAEMFPREVWFGGVRFSLGEAGKPNAVLSRGQTISLPAGKFNRVYLLAAAANGDQKGTFRIGDQPMELTIQEWTGFVGQWDTRMWKTTEAAIQQRPGAPPPPAGTPIRTRTNPYGEMVGIRPGFIKRSDIAWFSSQRRATDGNAEPYAYSYLFAYAVDLPAGAKTLTLPDNERIRILAVSVVDEPFGLTPAAPLYDTLMRSEQ
jgi:alpha-mannosidase